MSSKVPPFLQKTFHLLEVGHQPEVMSWSDDGHYVIIKDVEKFRTSLLNGIFKHGNYSSFIRQLNKYGFQKIKTGAKEDMFHHPSFRKGRGDLLEIIHKKAGKSEKQKHPLMMEKKEQPITINLEKADDDIFSSFQQVPLSGYDNGQDFIKKEEERSRSGSYDVSKQFFSLDSNDRLSNVMKLFDNNEKLLSDSLGAALSYFGSEKLKEVIGNLDPSEEARLGSIVSQLKPSNTKHSDMDNKGLEKQCYTDQHHIVNLQSLIKHEGKQLLCKLSPKTD
eukprot:TRINITY_DN1339_c0_g1_i18.p1 TRINITY_DN1339_c0_g1~~TRINITY_DN1339_c0_g1_i18.p1  ORF type:complete len:278 (-),score=32.93 TRINITY_DN1339_c0_g1_i18:21-854(-)